MAFVTEARPSDALELLERLAAVGAVEDRAAERRAEGILHRRVRRAAIRALGDGHDGELIEAGGDGHRCDVRRREAAQAKPLASLWRDSVARPWWVERDLHLDSPGQCEACEPRADLFPHDADGWAPHERRQQLDTDGLVIDAHRADDPQIDEADRRDLGIRDCREL